MNQIASSRLFQAAILAFVIFLGSGAVAVSSLLGSHSAREIDHAMWVTWLLVVPAFIASVVCGILAVHSSQDS